MAFISRIYIGQKGHKFTRTCALQLFTFLNNLYIVLFKRRRFKSFQYEENLKISHSKKT